MNVFQIPVSAIRAAQQGMTAVSANLANATTPGYHLQRAMLAETTPALEGNLRIGAGVTVEYIDRLRSAWLEQSLLRNTSSRGSSSAELEAARQLDTLFNPTEGSLQSRTEKLFQAWQDLATRPADGTVRRDLLAAADGVASELNQLSQSLIGLSRDFDVQITDTVNKINDLMSQIASLNTKIVVAEHSGSPVHDLSDRRDQLVSQLSELIDVESQERSGQPHVFSVANGAITITTRAQTLSLDQSTGEYQLVVDGWTSPLPAGGGRLQGLINARDSIILDAQRRLDDWGTQLIREIDQIHAHGVGLNGGFTVLTGERGIEDPTLPLTEVDGNFPVEAGELTITLTNKITGERTVHVIAIEPALESLDDVAAKINASPNLTAQISAQTGRLAIIADQSYSFDFTGQLPTQPDMSAWTGSSAITIGGTYTGAANADMRVSIVGSGTIGVTPDLRAEVRDTAGNILGVWNIGAGYVAGDKLTTSTGITLQFSAGTVVNAEQAGFRATADADTSRLLSTLGMNSLFSGEQAGGFAVRRSLMENPSNLAAARTDQDGNNTNAKAVAALALQRILDNSGMTFQEYLGQMTADAGSLVQEIQSTAAQIEQIGVDLNSQREAISGVDPNEELVKLLEFQRLFQSAARFVATVNQAYDDLMAVLS
jgi:flagellar hook-associated protein 1